MLLAYTADLALDRARGLIMAVVLVRRGANDEAFVFDRIGKFRRLGTSARAGSTNQARVRALATAMAPNQNAA